jgi:hypothetical protein
MNERLEDLRRGLAREAHDHNAKEGIKGLRWLLLHRRDTLEKDAAGRLERNPALNEPLQCAYLLKEELRELWEQKDGGEAWWIPGEWCAKAKATGIWQLHAMGKTLLRHAKEALSYYQTGLTSGRMERINRKIRGLLASASRFRDQDFLKTAFSTLSMKLKAKCRLRQNFRDAAQNVEEPTCKVHTNRKNWSSAVYWQKNPQHIPLQFLVIFSYEPVRKFFGSSLSSYV